MLDIDNLFKYHPPTEEQAIRYERLRLEFKHLAEFIIKMTPASAEQTLALRRLHDAQMMANCSIAVNE